MTEVNDELQKKVGERTLQELRNDAVKGAVVINMLLVGGMDREELAQMLAEFSKRYGIDLEYKGN